MKNWSYLSASLLMLLMFCGCGGTRMLRVPHPLVFTEPLSIASDQHLAAQLDAVIVRDGPGAWAKNVDWDEYIISLKNAGGAPLQITKFTAVDSLGSRIESLNDRQELVNGTKQTQRRYQGERIQLKAGLSPSGFLAAGTATLAGSAAVAGAAASSAGLGGYLIGSAAVVSGGLIVVPIAVGGISRAVNNGKVNQQIAMRQIQLPIVLREGQRERLHVFFPLTPSPRRLEITYVDSSGEHRLILDTNAALEGLHLTQTN